MKIIRAVERYIESAEIECEILSSLKDKDKDDDKGIVRLIEHFKFKENYCMVFENLGTSLYEILKMSNFRGFTMK